MKKCHFEYKGLKFDTISELYPIIKGEEESNSSPVDLKTGMINEALLPKRRGRVASSVTDIKSASEIDNLTQYKLNKFVKEVSLKHNFSDVHSIVKDYLVGGLKFNKDSIAKELFGREAYEVPKQMKSLRWVSEAEGRTIQEVANSIANDSDKNYGVNLDVQDVRNAIVDIINSYSDLNTIKRDFIETFLAGELQLEDVPESGTDATENGKIPNPAVRPIDAMPFSEFVKTITISEDDIDAARGAINNGAFIEGKELVLANGKVAIVHSIHPTKHDVLRYYIKGKEENGQETVSAERLYKSYATNLKYEAYLSATDPAFSEPPVANEEAITVTIPSTEEALRYEDKPQLTTPFLSADSETRFKSYGYDANKSTKENLQASLSKIIATTTDPVVKLLARKYLKSIEVFEGLDMFIDSDLATAGIASFYKDQSLGIRLNPNRIGNANQYARVLLEEMTHALTRQAARDNSEVRNRLADLYTQTIALYGKDKLAKELANQQELRSLERRINAGVDLTEEQQVRYDTLKDLLSDVDQRLIYAFSNFDEFIANIGVNRSLQKFLNDTKETDTQKSLYSKFVDIIIKILQALGMNIDNKGVFKYALHDMFGLINESINMSNTQRALMAKNVRSKAFVYSKFGLRGENNVKIAISNAEEVVNKINSTYTNIIAMHDTDTDTINLYYTDEIDKNVLKSIRDEYSDDASYSFDADFDTGSTNSFFSEGPGDLFDYSNIYEDAATDFDLQLKVYLSNLNDRLRSLQKSKNVALENIPTDKLERVAQARIVNSIEKQIDETKHIIRRITDKRASSVPFAGVISLAYQGMDELQNIEENTLNRKLSSSDIVYMLQTIKFWTNAKKHIFVDENYTDKVVNDLFSQVERLAEDKFNAVIPILDEYTKKYALDKHTRFKGTKEDIAKEFADLSKIEGLVNSLSVTDSSLLQAIGKEIKQVNEEMRDEVFEEVKQFEKIAKAAEVRLKAIATDKKDPHDIFRQRDNFGRKTRNIVTRFSHGYQKARKAALNFVYDSYSDRSASDAEKALKFLIDNTENIKYSVLFPLNDTDFNQEAHDAEVTRLKSLMSEHHFTEWYSQQSKAIEDFKKQRTFKMVELMEKFELTNLEEIQNHPTASRLYSYFMETNSIYELEKKRDNYTPGKAHFTAHKGYNTFKYVVEIPRATYKDGEKDMVSYDVNYNRIEKEPAIHTYYNAIRDSLSSVGSMIDFETGDKLSKNGLPEFKMEMYELFMDKGMKVGFDAFADTMYNMIRTEKEYQKDVKVDIITGKEKQRIPTGLWSSDSLINQELKLKEINYNNQHGVPPSEEQLEDWRSEITEKYANDMQGDLSTIIPMYIVLGLSYKHKSKLEDNLIVFREMFNTLSEYERDNKGQLKPDTSDVTGKSFLKLKPNDSFKRAKELIDGTYNNVLYGNTKDIRSGKRKILSPAEKRSKVIFEQALADLAKAYSEGVYNEEEYNNYKKALTKQIESLGAYVDKEKYFDLAVRYTQWKGMGWNIVGGISNALFGYTSNLIEAAGGQFYTQKELTDAYGKVFRHSFVRNATFNRGGGAEAVKIRSLMDRYTILSDSGTEFKSLVGMDLTERLNWLSAFNMNTRTEYINQAPLMLITFGKTNFEHNGKTYPIYEGFNTDGSWNTEEYGPYPKELVHKAVLKTKALVERNHGNYNPLSPVLAKRTGLGRLVMQFRTWMVEGVRVRLGDREGRYDEILEEEIKGRYISAVDVFKNDWKNASIGLGLQIIRNFIPFGNKWMANFTPIDKYIQGNENVTKTDIANMKRLAMELNIFIGTLVAMLAIKALAEGMDEDDPRKWAINLLMNQGTRLRTDVLMYVNPLEAQKIIQDPIPAMKIILDASKFYDAVHKTIIEGSPEYESGIYKGHNRILRNTMNLIPGLSQGYRITGQAWQMYDDK